MSPSAAFVSFRFGGRDGVSVEAAKWQWALQQLGFTTKTVAGQAPADHVIAGLGIEPDGAPDSDALRAATEAADLLVVDNLLSLPLNPAAASAVAEVARGRPTIVRHHDLPWQRPRFAGGRHSVDDDGAWRHVTINDRSRVELLARGIEAVTLRNRFDVDPTPGRGHAARAELGIGSSCLAMQPTRALERKGIPDALRIADALRATYWLLGPAEDGYDDELARLLDAATVPVLHGLGDWTVADAYAAADVVLFPSSWEGFGNPTVESAVHRRPLVIGDYPVARELAAFGFRWFPADDHRRIAAFLAAPDDALLEHNHAVARRHFSLADLPGELDALLAAAGWAW